MARFRGDGADRRRLENNRHKVTGRVQDFINPYPFMSSIEAMVHLELEARQVPFTWRWFDGDSPMLRLMLPDYAPEFTLREYKLVIVILGNFFGTLPGVLDRTSLAKVALEADGWTMVILYENEIRTEGAEAVLNSKAPQLKNPTIKGVVRQGPFGRPDLMKRARERLRSRNFLTRLNRLETVNSERSSERRTRRRSPRRRRYGGDRRRIGQNR
jgi:hypothetical protein